MLAGAFGFTDFVIVAYAYSCSLPQEGSNHFRRIDQAETHTITLPLQVFKYRPTLLPLVVSRQFDDRFKEKITAPYRGNLIRLQLPWTPKERGIYEELPVQLYSHDLFGFLKKLRCS